jgi:hypothetical protein
LKESPLKFSISAALVVLALSGAATAQVEPPRTPIASDFEGATSTGEPSRQPASPSGLRSIQKAASQVNLACAADRERLCADSKTSFGAGRCLDRHRKDVDDACRAALSRAVMAWSAPG